MVVDPRTRGGGARTQNSRVISLIICSQQKASTSIGLADNCHVSLRVDRIFKPDGLYYRSFLLVPQHSSQYVISLCRPLYSWDRVEAQQVREGPGLNP